MDFEALRKEIREYGKELGVERLSFLEAELFFRSDERYVEALRRNYLSGFIKRDETKRWDLKANLPSAKSVISVLVPYPNPNLYIDESRAQKEKISDSAGKFAAVAWGEDYHKVLGRILQKLADFIKERFGELEYLIMVDTGEVSDREIAAKAGLGWIGKNSNLINEELGSFVFIGELFINQDLGEAHHLVEDKCLDCDICVKACPVGAIDPENRIIDTRRCLAQQTLEKGERSEFIEAKIRETGYLYGCDICQLVCPYNRTTTDNNRLFKPDFSLVYPEYEEINSLSNKKFKEKYGETSSGWRGKKPIIKNVGAIRG